MTPTQMLLTLWAQGVIIAGCVGIALFVLARIVYGWLRKFDDFLDEYMQMHGGGEL